MKYLFLIILYFFFLCYIVAEQSGVQNNDDKHCRCIEYNCGCCTHLIVKGVLNGNLCSNFSYLPDEYGISATITYNNLAIFNETVSAKNPPPICIIHVDDIKMEICLHFYDLNIENKCFSGCAEFEVAFFKVMPIKHLKLGCFGCKNHSSSSLLHKKIIPTVFDDLRDSTKHSKDHPNVIQV